MKNSIINMTPHPIVLLDQNNNVVMTLDSKGLIRLGVQTIEVDSSIEGVRFTKTVFGEPVGLPEAVEGTFYIVSQLVKSALPNRTDLLVPAEVQRDEKGNILGCRSFGV